MSTPPRFAQGAPDGADSPHGIGNRGDGTKGKGYLGAVRATLPRMGYPGSRSRLWHEDLLDDAELITAHRVEQWRTVFALRWMGTVGSILIALGALGAGALPVVGNPYDNVPFGALMSRILQSASALVFIGIGLLVFAWIALAPFAGVNIRTWAGALRSRRPHSMRARLRPLADAPASAATATSGVEAADMLRRASVTTLPVNTWWRILAGWIIPLIFTAPMLTQDIYSYLAQGSIVRQGLDVYAAGPVQLLGAENHLARSVPFIWANSPSPYGPVALGIAAAISGATNDTIVLGVLAHRLVSILGIGCAGWAMTALARRCRVHPSTALWLGIANPLTILHLVGGIHNESILLGFLLAGLEIGLRGIGKLGAPGGWRTQAWLGYLVTSGFLISCAGMVKVTGFIGLGFVGMELARVTVLRRGWSPVRAVGTAVLLQLSILAGSIAVVSLVTGIDLGWLSSQGGAATVRSWLSLSTSAGVLSGALGMALGLGDHTDAMLTLTRGVGLVIALGFMVRLLLATFRGTISPIGGLGVSTLALVVLFPVVQPWYILWAVFPLAAWANRALFRGSVVAYSAVMCFLTLPRGLGLPPGTVAVIYLSAISGFAVVLGIWLVSLRRARVRVLH